MNYTYPLARLCLLIVGVLLFTEGIAQRQIAFPIKVLRTSPLIKTSINVINIVPNAQSNETIQDAEPSIAVNPSNTQQMAASAFTPNPLGGANAPIYISINGGNTWLLNTIVPGGNLFTGTGDITLRFGQNSNVLYAAILRGNAGLTMDILRTNNFAGAAAMTLLSTHPGDQPYVEATTTQTATGAQDRVYVGNNNISNRCPNGNTASVDLSLNAAVAAAPAGFGTNSIEPRATAAIPGPACNPGPASPQRSQDGPSVRTAIHPDGTVYGVYFGWRTFNATPTTNVSDVVVVRDNNWGAGANPFTALTDPADNLSGVLVVTGVSIPSLGTLMGAQRIGSSLSIAVDPRNSQIVYIAWADGTTAANYTIHVRRSGDGGQTWGNDLRTIVQATNPALAVNSNGKVGFLYQQLTGTAPNLQWVTHFERTTNAFSTAPTDLILAQFPDGPCTSFCGAGPIGDYAGLMAIGRNFYGIFSADNTPINGNFPNGVTYQRNANFSTNTLLGLNGTTAITNSVDPFFFSVIERNVLKFCFLNRLACKFDPRLTKDFVELKCLMEGCRVFDPIPKNCLLKYNGCPGCGPDGLCPPYYHIYLDGLEDHWHVTLIDDQYNVVPHELSRTTTGMVLSFRPSKEKFIDGQVGLYSLAFEMGAKGKVGRDYPVKTRLETGDYPWSRQKQ